MPKVADKTGKNRVKVKKLSSTFHRKFLKTNKKKGKKPPVKKDCVEPDHTYSGDGSTEPQPDYGNYENDLIVTPEFSHHMMGYLWSQAAQIKQDLSVEINPFLLQYSAEWYLKVNQNKFIMPSSKNKTRDTSLATDSLGQSVV